MTLHYRAEGRQSYAVLLFAPSTKPFDLFEPDRKGKVKLYVRRVFIADDAELLPAYLRFIRGVIDSEDLPLNISREMLQNNPQLAQIRKAVTGRVIGELENLGEKEPEAFAKIWDAFGPVIKEGIWEDFERREKLLALSRFTTTTGEKRSLKQYVEDLKPNQTEIYHLTGDSLERLKSNPKLESAKARGIEVLLLTDPVDAFWTSAPLDFGGKPLKSLSQGDIDFSLIPLLDDKADDKKEESGADEATTIAVIKDALGDRVSDVRASQRLTSSASCLVAGGDGRDRALERLLAQQNRGAITKPILEVNMRHPLVAAIPGDMDAARDVSLLLLEQAQILDGELPEDPAAFAIRLNQGVGFRSCQAMGRKLVHFKSALQRHRKAEPRLAHEQDQPPVLLCSLPQQIDLSVRKAVMRIFHVRALSKQRIGFVKKQHRAVRRGLGEDAPKILFGLADELAHHGGEVDAVEIASQLLRDRLGGRRGIPSAQQYRASDVRAHVRRRNDEPELRQIPRRQSHARPQGGDRPRNAGSRFHLAPLLGNRLRSASCSAACRVSNRDPGSSQRIQP
jgi:hypothetical protein